MSHNPITDWTLDVSRLRKMKRLGLSGVGLNECPEGLSRLDKLETLDMSDNRIDTLDQTMGRLLKLKRLNLRGNSIKVYIHQYLV